MPYKVVASKSGIKIFILSRISNKQVNQDKKLLTLV